MSKLLFIDCQVFQTPAWNRGMGKYSINLLRGIFNQEITDYGATMLIFNKNLPLDQEAKDALAKICPQAQKAFLDLSLPPKHRPITETRKLNSDRISEYIAANFQAADIDYLILSLFLDEACVVFPRQVRRVLLFYDLIPFLYHDRYIKRIPFNNYLAHFKTIFEADLILTISQTVADDLALHLGISREKLWNIDGASIDRSHLPAAQPTFNVPPKYVLMPSGNELRKNNIRAVKGFEEFNIAHESQYKLLITSKFSNDAIKELQDYSSNIIFTGDIPELQIQWLYENTDLLLFASEYEGLGLPILEGVSVNKRIACSNIPVFQEISPDAFYFFDHLDSSSIAHTIARALEGERWSSKKSSYKRIRQKYTWAHSAKAFIKALQQGPGKAETTKKDKLAIFTPHPAGFSAIGKVVAESHAAMSEYFDIDYFFDSGPNHKAVRPDYLSFIADCYQAADFGVQQYQNYDAVIYHVGNSEYHLETIKNALYLPGYIILHDTFLGGAFSNLKETGYISAARFALEEKLNSDSSGSFMTSLMNDQLGVITHSLYAKDAVESHLSVAGVATKAINLPLASPHAQTQSNGEPFTIGLAGILADVKGLDVIKNLASHPELAKARIHIFGHSFGELQTLKILAGYENVFIHQNPTDFEFQTRLRELDVLVNYRLEYRGETSLTVLEAMRYGITTIVRNIGWYAELPDNTIVKAADEDAAIEETLRLVRDDKLRKAIATNAYKLVKSKFTHEQYAEGIATLINTGRQASSPNAELGRAYRSSSNSKPEIKKLLMKLFAKARSR